MPNRHAAPAEVKQVQPAGLTVISFPEIQPSGLRFAAYDPTSALDRFLHNDLEGMRWLVEGHQDLDRLSREIAARQCMVAVPVCRRG
ncbi:hypothetical protein PY32053_04620 (plasmid) [Paracoccus yeei]|uniref:Uncharacterized protein n=1 Tax=Paracoccus yeei TaxID=147645 RepID=A0A386UTY0_9RHOB|nr:hypothetical protein [Paracoccus yeei]AYF04114.1 hypothetical protein PY32053_04620 [Paracoccus yeei]